MESEQHFFKLKKPHFGLKLMFSGVCRCFRNAEKVFKSLQNACQQRELILKRIFELKSSISSFEEVLLKNFSSQNDFFGRKIDLVYWAI